MEEQNREVDGRTGVQEAKHEIEDSDEGPPVSEAKQQDVDGSVSN